MSKTKSSLDADLDAYMSQSNWGKHWYISQTPVDISHKHLLIYLTWWRWTKTLCKSSHYSLLYQLLFGSTHDMNYALLGSCMVLVQLYISI
jgi:hypothetical protein